MIKIYEVVEVNQSGTSSRSRGFFDTPEKAFCFIENEKLKYVLSDQLRAPICSVKEKSIAEGEIKR